MIEGNPPRQADSEPLDEAGDSRLLRELTWAELVSRLAASREIGGTFHDNDGDGSFDPDFARRIAAQHNGKGFFNPDDLAHGK